MMLSDQGRYLPDDLLAKVDRASMRESLEARVPILDHHVVELSWRIPDHFKIRDGVTKWPLRRIAAHYLPERLLDRPKMGFMVPIHSWLRSGLREWARDATEDRARLSAIIDPVLQQQLWAKFEAGRNDLGLPMWALAVLGAWSRCHGVEF
jgi:asparagine synthase (glutamine-hydrolysing)